MAPSHTDSDINRRAQPTEMLCVMGTAASEVLAAARTAVCRLHCRFSKKSGKKRQILLLDTG